MSSTLSFHLQQKKDKLARKNQGKLIQKLEMILMMKYYAYWRKKSSLCTKKKWSSFKAKQKNKPNMIEKFSESLSRKSLPTGAANIIQAKLEQKIKSNHFADFTDSDIPHQVYGFSRK